MTAKEFQRRVTRDRSDFWDRFLGLLRSKRVKYCVIGGVAVNAYSEPVITLDFDVVVAAERLAELEVALRSVCKVERFEHSLNLTDSKSGIRIQIQTDEVFQDFLTRRRLATVVERKIYVASPEDLILSKIWAFQEPKRRESKRLKDLADIKRLLEVFPDLKHKVPSDVQQRMKL